jgi:parvulin-like peptidyl-prolyl isomerase
MHIQTTSPASSRGRLPLLAVIFAVLALLCLAGCGTGGGASGSGPLLAASISGHGISLDDYQGVLAAITASSALNGQQAASDWQTPSGRSALAQAQTSALNYLIDAELIHEQVVKQHIAVSQKDIAAEEKLLADNVKGTVKQSAGNPAAAAYKAAFNSRLIHLVAVVESEHKAFVAHGKIPTAQVRVIVLKGASKDVQAKAAQLAQQAKKGADFGQLAKQNSQDSQTAGQGGDLGTVYAGRFNAINAIFDTQIFTAKDTYVTVTDNGTVYLFQVTKRANTALSELKDEQTEGNNLDGWINNVVRVQAQAQIKQYVQPVTAVGQ